MYGINYLLIVCMLIVIMLKNRIDKYLVQADYTYKGRLPL